MTALFFLQKANIQHGQKILILGALGGVGIHAVQLAKHHFGAEVVGVCSTMKVEFVKTLGADRGIDYMKEDFSKQNETYDIIFDTFGKRSFSNNQLLKKKGAFLFATFGPRQLFHILWVTLIGSKKAISPLVKETTEDLTFIKELIEKGTIKPTADRSFPLEQAAEAHQYFE